MKYKKVLLLKADNEDDLIKKINDSPMDFFATPIKQKRDGEWIAICYYDPMKNPHVPSSTPTRRYPQKKVLATEKQLYYINKNNLDVNTEELSKYEASKIIEEHKKGGKK